MALASLYGFPIAKDILRRLRRPTSRLIHIHLADQALRILEGDKVSAHYSVSTAAKGAGEQRDSGCTPRGWHVIRAKVGAGRPLGSVLVGRRPTGEIYVPELAEVQPDRDWILSRILWLSGLEPGVNRLGEVDTMRRYIYIHGCPDTEPMGVAASHGCVRMRNEDLVELFEQVEVGVAVYIEEG